MHLVDMNGASLSRELQMEVPDEYVVIAKHQVMGFDDEQIAEIVSCEVGDLQEALLDPIFRAVKALVAGAHANQSLAQTNGWDALENMALEGLIKRAKHEKDPEFLLKMAAVANRATRKQAARPEVLDPMAKGISRISLTTRMVQMMTNQGDRVQEVSRELSITDGSMGRASFEEVDSLLNVKAEPVLPKEIEVQRSHQGDLNHDQLLNDLLDRKRNRS